MVVAALVLAQVTDAFVKGLFTSFLRSTMRRSLTCCAPGGFVQWDGTYSLKRSNRHVPMLNHTLMNVLAATQHVEQA